MKEDDGRWAAVEIYRSKANPEDVVLFFGENVYEGLNGGYRYFRGPNDRMLLTDDDGDIIETKTVIKAKKRKRSKAQNAKKAHDQRVDVIGENTSSFKSGQRRRTKAKFRTSEHPALTWDPARKQWKASIAIGDRVAVIGFYDTEHLAVNAYNQASKRFSKSDACNDMRVQHSGKMQTSIPKPKIQFNRTKYRVEVAFQENIKVVSINIRTHATS